MLAAVDTSVSEVIEVVCCPAVPSLLLLLLLLTPAGYNIMRVLGVKVRSCWTTAAQ
jgi:hypothetical protein